VIVLAKGDTQYDLMPGFYDLGASRTGLEINRDYEDVAFGIGQFPAPGIDYPIYRQTIKAQLAEVTWDQADMMIDRLGANPTLIFMFQHHETKLISAYIFYDCRRIPAERHIDLRSWGESMAIPVEFYFREAKIIKQRLDEEEKIIYTDLNEWLESLK
jgi:hypothetical protein